MITPQEALDYEVRTSLWAPYCRLKWAQYIMSAYYAAKVNRRIGRFAKRDRRLKILRAVMASGWTPK